MWRVLTLSRSSSRSRLPSRPANFSEGLAEADSSFLVHFCDCRGRIARSICLRANTDYFGIRTYLDPEDEEDADVASHDDESEGQCGAKDELVSEDS